MKVFQKQKEHVVIIVYIVILGYTLWRLLEQSNLQYALKYYSYSPDAYRLENQLYIYLNNRLFGLSYFTLLASMFIVWFIVIYFVLFENYKNLQNEKLLFIILVSAFLLYSSITNVLSYVLLVLIYKYRPKLLLILLIIIKESNFYLGFIYLVFTSQSKKERIQILIIGLISGLLYLIIRFSIIGNRPWYSEGFVFPWLIKPPTFLFTALFIFLFSLFYSSDSLYQKMVLAYLPILFLFSRIIELQLWIPIFLLALFLQIQQKTDIFKIKVSAHELNKPFWQINQPNELLLQKKRNCKK